MASNSTAISSTAQQPGSHWDGGNNFHLDSLTKVTCLNDPNIAPPQMRGLTPGEGRSHHGKLGATIGFL
jgi:hypothetical protein